MVLRLAAAAITNGGMGGAIAADAKTQDLGDGRGGGDWGGGGEQCPWGGQRRSRSGQGGHLIPGRLARGRVWGRG